MTDESTSETDGERSQLGGSRAGADGSSKLPWWPRWLKFSEKNDQTVQTGFRAFSPVEFCPTSSWSRLEKILRGNGGCYGLYGPRGSGKSWLMLNAIHYAGAEGGMGLWFPSPSEYDANAFLSSLSDNLANAVERRFILNNGIVGILDAARRLLTFIVAVPLSLAVIIYLVRGFVGASVITTRQSLYSILPSWLWIVVVAGAVMLFAVLAIQYGRNNTPEGRLAREATALRERIRFTATLKHGDEVGLTGTLKALTATLKRSSEKALAERPATIASLVFDFRNLAELIAHVLRGPVVIGIDELDKIQDPEAVRSLLRDIKGIFEVTGVHFLVSVSEEAAASLQLGTLQAGGRNEFNSSFYTVLTLPPLDGTEAEQLLRRRGYDVTPAQVRALCLISAGNQRELVRVADATLKEPTVGNSETDIVLSAMRDESHALLMEIIRTPNVNHKWHAWLALPRESFQSADSFTNLSKKALSELWDPEWFDNSWNDLKESWRRLLVRLCIFADMLQMRNEGPQNAKMLCTDQLYIDLLNVVIMTGQDAQVARAMLESRSGLAISDYLNSRDQS